MVSGIFSCVLLLLMVVNFAHCEWWHWLTLFAMSRKILLFPKGNSVDHLSLYLDVADSMTLAPGWSRFAQFCLTVVNQFNTQYSFRKGNFSDRCLTKMYSLYYVDSEMEELKLPHLSVDLVFHMPKSEAVAYSFVHNVLNVLNLMETIPEYKLCFLSVQQYFRKQRWFLDAAKA